MTTEEKLRELLNRWNDAFKDGWPLSLKDDLVILVSHERRAAKREERERCKAEATKPWTSVEQNSEWITDAQLIAIRIDALKDEE